jgi:anthranilate/para-aminobenzoate synthase component I
MDRSDPLRSAAFDRRAEPLVSTTTWLRFPAVVRIDHASGEVLLVGDSDRAIDRLAKAASHRAEAPEPPRLHVNDADPPERHLARVRRAIELILAGDLYQVSLARRLDLRLEGDPLAAYATMAARSPAAYGAALELEGSWVLSTSPELLLRGPDQHGLIATEPIKGTRPRGDDEASDQRLKLELDADEKERAELAMILDVERNDLGRVARVGSVRIAHPPHVVTHRTIHHRKALLVARPRPDVTRRRLLEAMVPSGSVTGAPKIRAMEVIASLEAHRRGLYTGALGFAAHDGSFTLAMAIRTAVVRGRRDSYSGEYFTGGGIVADSQPDRELAETHWKAIVLSDDGEREGYFSRSRGISSTKLQGR